jgi:prophage regulatory protein|tara:strand:+ start:6438 stop:6656 length:219 start_codon:yes stop_codon:yes gene_type:complete
MQSYFTLTEVRSKLGGRSRSAIYLDLAHGRLPQPIKLGGRLYWPEGDLEAHLKNLQKVGTEVGQETPRGGAA